MTEKKLFSVLEKLVRSQVRRQKQAVKDEQERLALVEDLAVLFRGLVADLRKRPKLPKFPKVAVRP